MAEDNQDYLDGVSAEDLPDPDAKSTNAGNPNVETSSGTDIPQGKNYVPTTPELYAEDEKTFTVLGPDQDNPGQAKTMTYPKDFSNPAVEKLYNMSSEAANKNPTITPESSVTNMDSGGKPQVSSTPTGPGSFGVMRSDANPASNDNPEIDQNRTPTATFGGGKNGQGLGTGGLLPYETETSTSRHIISPQEKKAMDDIHQTNMDLVDATKKKIVADTQLDANATQLRAADAAKELQSFQEREMQRQQGIKQHMDEYKAAADKYNNMNIDPHHAFGDGATPSKILAGIGLAMGAIGQAHGGGPNMAIGIIQNAIKQDIEIQKANIEKARGSVEMARGGLEMFRQISSDDETAHDLEYKRIVDNTSAKINQMAVGTRDANAKVQLAQLSQGLAKESFDVTNKIYGATQTKVDKSMMAGMIGKSDAGVNKEITSSEEMGQRFHTVADEIENAKKTGGIETSGSFKKWLNTKERVVGLDNPKLTAFQEKVENLFVDQAKLSGLTRAEGLKYFEKIGGNKTDNPDTLIDLLRQEGDKETAHGTMQRNAHAGQLRLPNKPNTPTSNYSNLNPKRNTKVGH